MATLVDVRRFPGSRRNPQFTQQALAAALAEAGIGYRRAVELGDQGSFKRSDSLNTLRTRTGSETLLSE